MKQLFYLLLVSMVGLSACTGSFKKSDEGIEYKIIKKGTKDTIAYGDFLQFNIKQIYSGDKDTLLMDTRDYSPRIILFDSANTPPAYFKIISQLKKGDSLVVRIPTDSVYKAGGQQEMPPYMKKGKFIYWHYSLLNILKSKAEADSAFIAENTLAKPKLLVKQKEEIEKELATKQTQLNTDIKIIEDYLLKNNIKAERTKWGTFYAITSEGTGEKLNNARVAAVNYTGRTLDSGKVFDSNIDPKFNHVEPYDVNLTEFGGVILGWTDALSKLKNGSKATIYVPSSLAYGVNGQGGDIKPNDNLIFDIEIVGSETEGEYIVRQRAKQEEMTRKMQQLQQQQKQQQQNAPTPEK